MDRSNERPLRALLLGLVSALGVLAPGSASAFCRTTTVSVPADYDPTQGCFTEGNLLWWRNACVGYSIQQSASRQVTLEQAEQAMATAFTKWTSTACPADDAGQARVSIDVRDEGPVACDTVQYNQTQPNQHVIMFRDDVWPYDDSNNTLALTTVTFDTDTGEIYDADMEINSTMTLTAWDPTNPDAPIPNGGYDFLSIVTHETGHFLGMAHSADIQATMYAHYTPGETVMRLLTADDVAGICSIYAPDGTRNASMAAVPPDGIVPEGACDATPRHGFTSECCAKLEVGADGKPTGQCAPPPTCGVASAPGRTGDGRLALAFAGLFALSCARRSRARWRSRASA